MVVGEENEAIVVELLIKQPVANGEPFEVDGEAALVLHNAGGERGHVVPCVALASHVEIVRLELRELK